MTSATIAVPRRRGGRGAAASEQPAAPRGFRRDIQGLRAVAVVLVLLYHAGMPGLPGGYVGVDVFFVISGFLITGLIVREIERTGHLSLTRFYARRARRLLPATALVFVAVAAIALVFLPVSQWRTLAGDMVAASLYVVNWRFASQSVDYLAADTASSPLQHFWSLAVEEQFYVVWPLLILAMLWWARRRSAGPLSRGRLGIGLLVIAVPSLAWSVHLTATNPGQAYFVTTTRLWELAVGALLAVGADRVGRLPVAARHTLGWAGIAAIAVTALTFTDATPFPGAAALLPVLGATAVIAAGTGDQRGAVWPLTTAPFQDIGALSYSLYLWHWPVLIAATAYWGAPGEPLRVPTALLAVGFSAVPAWFAYRVVEDPLHHARWLAAPRRALAAGLVCVLIGLTAAGATAWAADRKREQERRDVAASGASFVGGATLGPDRPADDWRPEDRNPTAFVPTPTDIADDVSGMGDESCIGASGAHRIQRCDYGDGDGARVYVVGDSKMHQWLGALQQIADRRGWHLVTLLQSACPFSTGITVADGDGAPNTGCATTNEKRLPYLVADGHAEYALVSQSSTILACASADCTDKSADLTTDALTTTLQAVADAGVRPVVVADNYHPASNMIDCVAAHPDEVSACEFRLKDVDTPPLDLAAEATGTPVVDLQPWITPGGRGWPVIGGVTVYRQGSHLTDTYATSLADVLEAQLVAAGLP